LVMHDWYFPASSCSQFFCKAALLKSKSPPINRHELLSLIATGCQLGLTTNYRI
jgi:hypothetical protein